MEVGEPGESVGVWEGGRRVELLGDGVDVDGCVLRLEMRLKCELEASEIDLRWFAVAIVCRNSTDEVFFNESA